MRKFILTVALVTLSSSVLARDEQKVYKWVDEDGNVFFSDKIPVDASDHPKDVLNDRGVTIDNLEGKNRSVKKTNSALHKSYRFERTGPCWRLTFPSMKSRCTVTGESSFSRPRRE
jgi:hypothetical protein